MKKNRSKLVFLIAMFVFSGMTLLIATQTFAKVLNKTDVVFGQGVGGFCICPHCGEKQEHKTGVPCRSVNCPKCGSAMLKDLQKNNTAVEKPEISSKQDSQDNIEAWKRQEPTGFCVCPHCGEKQKHERGFPCQSIVCPKCKSTMVRD